MDHLDQPGPRFEVRVTPDLTLALTCWRCGRSQTYRISPRSGIVVEVIHYSECDPVF